MGYCLLPMVVLAFISIFLDLHGFIGVVMSMLVVAWCTYSASLMFVTVLNMRDQRALVAYPVFLLYACFSILAVFRTSK